MTQVNFLVTNQQGCHLQSHNWSILSTIAMIPHMYEIEDTYTDTSVLPVILNSHNPILVTQLFPIIFPYVDPNQAPSNKSSGFPYTVTSVEHYVGPINISTYVTSDI